MTKEIVTGIFTNKILVPLDVVGDIDTVNDYKSLLVEIQLELANRAIRDGRDYVIGKGNIFVCKDVDFCRPYVSIIRIALVNWSDAFVGDFVDLKAFHSFDNFIDAGDGVEFERYRGQLWKRTM